MQPITLECFTLKHSVIFFYSDKFIRRTLGLKYGGNDSLKKTRMSAGGFFLRSWVPWKQSGAGYAGNFQKSPKNVCSTSSAGEGKAQTAAKVTVTTGNMLYMLSSTGWEAADNKGLTHLSVAQSWAKVSPCGGTWQLQSAAYFMSALIPTLGLAILPVIYSVHSDSPPKKTGGEKSLR